MKCLKCEEDFLTGKSLSNHLKRSHNTDGIQYTIEHLYAGVRPLCLSCGEETRYTAFQFKKYCLECASIAMKEGGRLGGKNPAWNKGKTAVDDERISSLARRQSGTGNPFWGKKHDDDTREKISMSKRLFGGEIESRLAQRAHEFVCITPIKEYVSRQRQYLRFQCVVCSNIQDKTLQAFERGSLCESCYPNNASQWQLEVEKWLTDIGVNVKRGDRAVISPKEIDIYLPDYNVGIECHGLYFHSDAKKDNNPKLHAQKADLAVKSGIKLVQIFYDEWRDKNEIVKEMIMHRIGHHKNVVGARKCKIIMLDSKQQKEFFEKSHLSGYSPARAAWGLTYNDVVVACLSIRVPRQKKWNERFEISRFALLPGYSIPGALSRLSKIALTYTKSEGKIGIMTYVDRRVGAGSGYTKTGFLKVGETGPDYWYTDFSYRYDRFSFRARNGVSEKDIVKAANLHKVWGAGSLIFTFDKVGNT